MVNGKYNESSGKTPLVSVVMTSYNHEKYIASAVDSITSQSYDNVQLIVVDDGSTDSSADIIRKRAKDKGFLFVEKKNGGLVSTINEGFKYVKGDYVVFHGSDDISVNDRIKIQVDQLSRFPSVGYLNSNLRFIDELGNPFDVLYKEDTDAEIYTFDDFMRGRAHSTIVSCMFRRSALEKVMPLDESLLSEDFQLFMKITYAGYQCLAWETVPIINYRVHKAGLSKTKLPALMRAQMRMIEEYKDHRYYRTAIVLTKRQIFAAMVVDEKLAACKFLFKNIQILNFSLMRSIGKLFLPKKIIVDIKKILVNSKYSNMGSVDRE